MAGTSANTTASRTPGFLLRTLAIGAAALAYSLPIHSAEKPDCYNVIRETLYQLYVHPDESFFLLSDGSTVPIGKSWESEGTLYANISPFFDRVDRDRAIAHMTQQLYAEAPSLKYQDLNGFLRDYVQKYKPENVKLTQDAWDAMSRKQKLAFVEKNEGIQHNLLSFLREYVYEYKPDRVKMTQKEWEKMSPEQQLAFVTAPANIFERINMDGRNHLFYHGVIKWDDLVPSEKTPPYMQISDDLGGYEIKGKGGADRADFIRQRDEVEDQLGSHIGHEHSIHAWPVERAGREKMVGQYIETLDSTTWYLYWRSIMHQTRAEDGDGGKVKSAEKGTLNSIIDHQYLGVYTRPSLDRLAKAVVEGDAGNVVRDEKGEPVKDKDGKIKYSKKFENKFRFIGARSMPAREGQPSDGREMLPNWEMRSGNKGIKRGFVENMIDGRLSTGDWSGMRDYRSYEFDANTSLRDLTKKYLNEEQIAKLEWFEQNLPKLEFNPDKRAYNHYRNKLIAPLLPWENRINLEPKMKTYLKAQQAFAQRLVELSDSFKAQLPAADTPYKLGVLRKRILKQIQLEVYNFEKKVRLDQDFERYLKPKPTNKLPDVRVKTTGPIDVNAVDTGIEYSFRFAAKVKSKKEAAAKILEGAQAFAKAMGGGEVKAVESEGAHGHGIAVKYEYVDPQGRKWRFEWDGIGRSYKDGKPINPRGGHMEVPSPKDAPEDSDEFQLLYRTLRGLEMEPRRGAGGAHINVDLGPLMKLAPKVGARKAANLIAYFESRRQMVSFLWQHPFRKRVALPADLSTDFIDELNNFKGDWDDLGRLLYKNKYFNLLETRKPKYMQMNATALMRKAIPRKFRKDIDIKNPDVKWEPGFGESGGGRLEFRLFDAMPDERMAALQLKYLRAMLNAAWNAPGTVKLEPQYWQNAAMKWRDDPKLFIQEASKHLVELGLDPDEFAPILVDAVAAQQARPRSKPIPAMHQDWGPKSDGKKKTKH